VLQRAFGRWAVLPTKIAKALGTLAGVEIELTVKKE
jgi:hypothetical protein